MTAPKWREGRLLGFDTETTGINVHTDQIITAAIVHTAPDQRPRPIQWILNPGIDVPTEASDVHGWTTERLNAFVKPGHAVRIGYEGNHMPMPIDGALGEIAGQLATAMHCETPVIATNAAYDFTILETELVRHSVDTIGSRPTGVRGIVDPQVLDKQWDQYRRQCYKAPGCDPENQVHECTGCRGGKYKCGGCGRRDRQLTSLCAHYGIRMVGAHDATADALGALRLAKKLGEVWPDAGRLKLSTLFQKQIEWRRDQQIGLRQYFDKVGKEHDGMCPEWPVHVRCAPAAAAGAVA